MIAWMYNLLAILAYISGIVALWNLLSLYLNTNLVWPNVLMNSLHMKRG